MIKIIRTPMLLGYSLLNKSKISFLELISIKNKIEKQLKDFYVNISEKEIYQAVKDYPTKYRTEINNGVLIVYRKYLDEEWFLDECYKSFFSTKEFATIKKYM